MSNVLHGINGDLIIGDKEVTIKRGLKGIVLNNDNQVADFSIPFDKVAGIKYREATKFRVGQLSIKDNIQANSLILKIAESIGNIIINFFPIASSGSITFEYRENDAFRNAYQVLNQKIIENLNKSKIS